MIPVLDFDGDDTMKSHSAHISPQGCRLLRTMFTPSFPRVRTKCTHCEHNPNPDCRRQKITVSAQISGRNRRHQRDLFARLRFLRAQPFIERVSTAFAEFDNAQDSLCQMIVFGDQVGWGDTQCLGKLPKHVKTRLMNPALVARNADAGRPLIQPDGDTQGILGHFSTQTCFAQSFAEDAASRFQASL